MALLGNEFDSNDFILAFKNMFPQEYANALLEAGSYQSLHVWITNEILRKAYANLILAVGKNERLSVNRNRTINVLWRKI